jgi:hypothetical protein
MKLKAAFVHTSFVVCGAGLLFAAVAGAGTITKPYTFVDGDPAVAAEVNANFDTVYDQVNINTPAIGTKQDRVSGTCPTGSSIRTIAENGTVTCETDDVGSGDITGVTAGSGLTGGGTSGSVTLSIPAGGVTAAHIAADAVGSSEIAAGAVGSSEIADAIRTISIPARALSASPSSTDTTLEFNGYRMKPTYAASVNGVIPLPANYAGGSVTMYLYFTNIGGVSGTVDFFIRAAGRYVGEVMSDPGSITSSGAVTVSTHTSLYKQTFVISNVAASDDILHIYGIQRGGPGESHTGDVSLVGIEIAYTASY